MGTNLCIQYCVYMEHNSMDIGTVSNCRSVIVFLFVNSLSTVHETRIPSCIFLDYLSTWELTIMSEHSQAAFFDGANVKSNVMTSYAATDLCIWFQASKDMA